MSNDRTDDREPNSEHSNVFRTNRRSVLGGAAALGVAGLLGGTRPAHAAPQDAPWAPDKHDHSGEHGTATRLGQIAPLESIRTDELNNVEIVRPGDDIQAAIDAVYDPLDGGRSAGDRSGMVRFLPSQPDDMLLYEFSDPPYVVRPGVTLDMRGIAVKFSTDAEVMFDLREGVDVLGHGAHFEEGRPAAFTGALWAVRGDPPHRAHVARSARVLGFPRLDVHVLEEGGHATTILLEQTVGNDRDVGPAPAAVGGCYFEIGLTNAKNIVRVNSTGKGGWINHNTVNATGAVAHGNAVEYNVDAGWANGNYVWVDHLQIKAGTKRILYCHGDKGGMKRNYLAGNFVDFKNLTTAIAEWTSTAGHTNPMLTTQDNLGLAATSDTGHPAIDNSGTYGNYIGHLYKSGQKPFDLSKRNGFFDGERALDDGTNTAHRGVECTWDNVGVAWVRPDGTTFEGERDWFHPPPTFSVPNQSLSVDGSVSELSQTHGLSVTEDFSVHLRDPTVGGMVWVTWDQSNLYLAADITDNEHTQPETGSAVSWSGDVFELGVANGKPSDDNQITRITAALTPDGPQITKGTFPGDWYVGKLDVPAEIVRTEKTNHTRYEVAVPWGILPVDAAADVLSLSLAIRDVDATKSSRDDGKTGYREWGGGLLGGKDTTQFNRAELAGD